jgi:uncharacterized protein YndB with AHSA1/START domain
MTDLPHRLDRSIVIRAPRETVFSFFERADRWASWWGTGSTIDPRPGGRIYIRYPGGVEVAGEVLEITTPERLVFTYGFVKGEPIPAGSSRATIRLEPVAAGTRLWLSHEFANAAVRDEHVQGWRYQLSVFANVVANLVHARASDAVDGWFDAWAETDAAARERKLAGIATPDVTFRDQYSVIDGLPDLLPHLEAAQRFMPDVRMRRHGDVRHSHGTVIADWVAASSDGKERAKGTNVFTLNQDGRIETVTGFWS